MFEWIINFSTLDAAVRLIVQTFIVYLQVNHVFKQTVNSLEIPWLVSVCQLTSKG